MAFRIALGFRWALGKGEPSRFLSVLYLALCVGVQVGERLVPIFTYYV